MGTWQEQFGELETPVLARSLGRFFIDQVKEMDQQCNMLIRGIEGGLCNVRAQFAAAAHADIGKKLTEETVISWFIHRQIIAEGGKSQLERHYPGSLQECDLVIDQGDARIWVEVKLAWKRWYSCTGEDKRNPFFMGYLLGDQTHPGLAHDFEKLEAIHPPTGHWLGILLIGFDKVGAEMDPQIDELNRQQSLDARGWSLAHRVSWTDRRNTDFRIGCWYWLREAK